MSDRMLLDRMLECLSYRVSIGGNRSTKVILLYLRYVLNISERIYEHGKRIIRIILYDCILQHFEIKSSIVLSSFMAAWFRLRCVVWCPRFNERRKEFVHDKILRPTKKPRHPKLNLKEIIKKSEEDYVDFCQASQGFVVKQFQFVGHPLANSYGRFHFVKLVLHFPMSATSQPSFFAILFERLYSYQLNDCKLGQRMDLTLNAILQDSFAAFVNKVTGAWWRKFGKCKTCMWKGLFILPQCAVTEASGTGCRTFYFLPLGYWLHWPVTCDVDRNIVTLTFQFLWLKSVAFSSTVCPHWGVITARVKASAWSGGWSGAAFSCKFWCRMALVTCPCAFPLSQSVAAVFFL